MEDGSLEPCFRKLFEAQTPHKKGDIYKKNGLIYRRAEIGEQEHAKSRPFITYGTNTGNETCNSVE